MHCITEMMLDNGLKESPGSSRQTLCKAYIMLAKKNSLFCVEEENLLLVYFDCHHLTTTVSRHSQSHPRPHPDLIHILTLFLTTTTVLTLTVIIILGIG